MHACATTTRKSTLRGRRCRTVFRTQEHFDGTLRALQPDLDLLRGVGNFEARLGWRFDGDHRLVVVVVDATNIVVCYVRQREQARQGKLNKSQFCYLEGTQELFSIL